MYVTEDMKSHAVEAMILSAYEKKIFAALAKRNDAALAARAAFHGTDLDLMESLPDGWLAPRPCFEFIFNGKAVSIPYGDADGIEFVADRTRIIVGETGPVFYRRLGVDIVITTGHEHRAAFEAAMRAATYVDTLAQEIRRLSADASSALKPVQYRQQMAVVWPEAIPFFEPLEPRQGDPEKRHPSPLRSTLNHRLGLGKIDEPLAVPA